MKHIKLADPLINPVFELTYDMQLHYVCTSYSTARITDFTSGWVTVPLVSLLTNLVCTFINYHSTFINISLCKCLIIHEHNYIHINFIEGSNSEPVQISSMYIIHNITSM
jgi:hypothetical protein